MYLVDTINISNIDQIQMTLRTNTFSRFFHEVESIHYDKLFFKTLAYMEITVSRT